MNHLLKIIAVIIFCMLVSLGGIPNSGMAQIAGLTLRTPPMTHALIDEGDGIIAVGLSYTRIEYPPYKVNDVTAEEVEYIEEFGFIGYGVSDMIAIGASSNPTQINVKGSDNNSNRVDTTLHSVRNYFYLIPTLSKWNKNRIALIFGKGRATYIENTDLGIEQTEYDIGTTGLVAEVFLFDEFSLVPWASWPYLIIDIDPPTINEIQDPDYGIDGIMHFGDVKISVSMAFQALETSNEVSGSDDEEESGADESETTQENYSISLSYRF